MKVSEMDPKCSPLHDEDLLYVVDHQYGSMKMSGEVFKQTLSNNVSVTTDLENPEHVIIKIAGV